MNYRTFQIEEVFRAVGDLWPYAATSLLILAAALAAGMLLGLLLAFMLQAGGRVVSLPARLYLRILRGAPAVVLLLLVYYGLPQVLQRLGLSEAAQINRLAAVIVAFALIASAQMANIYTAAYGAIPAAQREAAKAVGYTDRDRFLRVLLPQGIRLALPNLANTATWLLKEGAVAYTIGVIDVVGRAQLRISARFGGAAMETYAALALIFFILIRAIELLFRLIETRASRHVNRGGELIFRD